MKSATAFFRFSLSIALSKIIDSISSNTITLESLAHNPRPNTLDIGQTSRIKNKLRNVDKNRFTQIDLTVKLTFAKTQTLLPIAWLKNFVQTVHGLHEKHFAFFLKVDPDWSVFQ